MRVLIAAGGTGGHIYPALAVVRALRERHPDVELRWLGGHRGLEGGLVPPTRIRFDRLLLRSLRSVDLSVHAATDPVRLGASYPQALALLTTWRPNAIFTTGGYVAIPVLGAAATLRIPSLLWEGNVIPGRSVRATAPLATAVAVSFEQSCGSLRGRCYVTGTPIRSLLGIDRAAARARFGITDDAPVLLVFGGSQRVRRFEEAVWSVLPEVAGRAWTIHVTGEPSYAEALRRRESLPPDRRARYIPRPFLRDEMGDALVASDIVVGRAGSSTLAEVAAAGKPIAVVPYPHAAGHQAANTRELEASGGALVIPDEAFDGDAVLRVVALAEDAERMRGMGAASRALGRPRAAEALVSILEAMAEHRPLPTPDAVSRMAAGGAA